MTIKPALARLSRAPRPQSEPAPRLADVYEQLGSAVLRFFARRCRDSELALDLTAETFAKAFEKQDDFRGRTQTELAAWVWSIARNELARYHRTRTVELTAFRRLGLERQQPNDQELAHIEELTAKELVSEHLQLAVATLPDEQQQVIRMRFVDELTYLDIAEKLGVSHDVVRARASRAMRTLRASEHLKAAVKVLET